MTVALASLLSVGALLSAFPAFGQEVQARPQAASIAPRDHYIDVGLSLGYARGVGDMGGGQPGLSDVAGSGGELGLTIGYRVNRKLSLGIYGTGSKYSRGSLAPSDGDVWSASAGIQSTWHFAPGSRFDPWILSGGGWRGHWVSKPEGVDSRQGLDLSRVQVGVDYRVSPSVCVAPYLGATLTVFKSQQLAGESRFSSVEDKGLTVFLSGGVSGRFGVFERGEG